MMEAKPVTLPVSAVAAETENGAEELYVFTQMLSDAAGWGLVGSRGSPAGAAQVTDSRYRLLLTVDGREDLRGVYYVSGYLDEGLCGLQRDEYLTRRETIRLKKRGYL